MPLDQITVDWNRLWRSSDRVNLIYPFELERIHVTIRNRVAIPYGHDPLFGYRPCDDWRYKGSVMKELLRTNDIVRLSWLEALLADAGIETLVLDLHTSVVEGSIGILPRRLMVSDDDHPRACRVLRDAGEGAILP
jgi:hypothetical protein